jgi:hypothetical protein
MNQYVTFDYQIQSIIIYIVGIFGVSLRSTPKMSTIHLCNGLVNIFQIRI